MPTLLKIAVGTLRPLNLPILGDFEWFDSPKIGGRGAIIYPGIEDRTAYLEKYPEETEERLNTREKRSRLLQEEIACSTGLALKPPGIRILRLLQRIVVQIRHIRW